MTQIEKHEGVAVERKNLSPMEKITTLKNLKVGPAPLIMAVKNFWLHVTYYNQILFHEIFRSPKTKKCEELKFRVMCKAF